MKTSIYFFLIFTFLASSLASAQEKTLIVYKGSAADLNILKQYNSPTYWFDSVSVVQSLHELTRALQRDGYLLASVDSIKIIKEQVEVFISAGEKFFWANLRPGNIEEGVLNSIGYRERFYRKKPFKYQEVGSLMQAIITYSENNGYPFASVRLDSVAIDRNTVTAALNYTQGPLITFDTVEIIGKTKTTPLFLSYYLRIKPGDYYEEKKVKYAFNKLKRLPYLKIMGPSYVTFQLKEGTPHFNLTDVNANQVDGVIGLLPNEGKNSRPLITGQFNLLLQNMFGTGKKISLQWQRPQVNSQNLEVEYLHPNILRSPVNIQARFFLLKEDTLFLNRDFLLEASLLSGKNSTIKVFGDFKVARVIATEASPGEDVTAQYADFNLNQYGVGYEFSNLNDYIVPTKGLGFSLDGAVGNKKIRPSAETSDSVDLSIVQYNLSGVLNYYYPLTKRIVLRSKISGGSVVSEQIFTNDLFRIGGLKTLRGFVENEFYASDYVIGTIESQFFLDNSSYLFLFYDQGYLKTGIGFGREEFPAGLGSGLTLTTKAGVFTFVYALGRTSVQPLSINFSKIHFGYITRF